jgi:hypothetical protein
LLLQEHLEFVGKLGVVKFSRPITAELAIETLGQARQNNFHQLSAHGQPSKGGIANSLWRRQSSVQVAPA